MLGVNTECRGPVSYYYCLTNYPKCSDVKQQFYCAQGFSESGIRKLVFPLWYQWPQLGRCEYIKKRTHWLWAGIIWRLTYSCLAPGLGGLKGYLWLGPLWGFTCSLQGTSKELDFWLGGFCLQAEVFQWARWHCLFWPDLKGTSLCHIVLVTKES